VASLTSRLAQCARRQPQARWESRSLPGLFVEGPLRTRGAFFYVRQAWPAAPWLALSTDSESESGSDREVTWRCKSSGDLDARTPELNGNCGAAMRRGKEAAGKAPARGVRTADEAQRWWARGHKDSKPDVIRTGAAQMRRVDGVNVTRLTLADLSACLRARPATRLDDARAEVSRGHSSDVAPS
jgi:hypothetical protein